MAQPPALPAPPGYGPIVPLDRQAHAGRGASAQRRGAFARGNHILYLTSEEFFQAALDYPLAFVLQPQGDAAPVALLGLEEGRNLCVDAAGRWPAGRYVPAVARRYPFCVVRVRVPSGEQRLICVDEQGLDAKAPAYFDAAGNASPEWQAMQQLIDQLEGAQQATEAFCARLREHDLLVPFDVHVKLKGGRKHHVAGLSRVDEERLRALDDATLAAWTRDGTLARVHAHLLSLNHLARFPDRCV
ncbi:MAG TPA: SapC family protein [Gammaproteobacteria bacterium]